MIIKRENFKSIKKRIIPLNNLVNYESIDISALNRLLNETISGLTFNTFDLMHLLMKNYEGNLLKAIKRIEDYSSVRFNCYYACMKLKKFLSTLNIKAYIISYKSIGFSNELGDDLIKEAHMSLVIPTLKDNKVYYLLLDPGLRIPEVIGFFKSDEETDMMIDNDKITIKKCKGIYNYTMIMEGYNRYSTSNTSYICQEYFDILHEVVNPSDVLFPVSFNVLLGYRAIRFSEFLERSACIKLMVVDEYVEIISGSNIKRLTFSEINKMNDANLKKYLAPATKILKLDTYEFMILIRFILNIKDEIKNTLLYSVL